MSHHFTAEVELYANETPDLPPSMSDGVESQLREAPESILYVIKSPASLRTFAAKGHHDINIQDGVSIPIANSQVTNVKLCLLAPITAATSLSHEELMGGIDKEFGETVSGLVQEWREAFKGVQEGHAFEHIVFDMSCVQDVEIDHIIRLIQQISTVLVMKRKRAGSGKGLSFEVVGTTEKKKRWLEKACPSIVVE